MGVDAYWVCVSDGEVASVAALIPPGSVVLHASGALDIDVLRVYPAA